MGIEYLLGAIGLGAVVGALARKEDRRRRQVQPLGFSAAEWQREYDEFRRRLENTGEPARSPRPYEPRVPQTAESTISDEKLDDLKKKLCDMAREYEDAGDSRKKELKKAFDTELSKLDSFTRGLVKDYLKRACSPPRLPGEPIPPLPPRPFRTKIVFIEQSRGPVRTIDTSQPTRPEPPSEPAGPSSEERIIITPRTIPKPAPEPTVPGVPTVPAEPSSYYYAPGVGPGMNLRNQLLSIARGPTGLAEQSMAADGALWTGSILSLSGRKARLPTGPTRRGLE